MLSRNVQIALASSAAAVFLASCSGGSSPSSSAGMSPVSQSQVARQASSISRIANSATGKMGLPSGFHGMLFGVPERSPGWMSEDAKSGSAKVYVSDDAANAVYIYNAKKLGSPIGTITTGISGPLGNFVDENGDLYVTNLSNNTVTVYKKGATSPYKTLSNGLSGPIGVCVGEDGTVYVSEYSAGLVIEYDKGATSPSRTLTPGNAEGVALDSKNNLYVSYNDPNTGAGAVQKFAPKSTTGTNLGISVQFAGDLKLDKKNDLLLEDQISQTVNFYKPGATTAYGAISVSGVDTYKLALNSKESLAYVASASTTVPVFQAKPNGASAGTITGLQAATGVSLNPPPPL